jgi:hypothetical protein
MAIQERDFERIMNEARVRLPGVSDAGLKGTMFDVIDEFFDNSNAWIEWLNVNLVVGSQTYTLYPQQGGMLNRLVTLLDSNNVVYPAVVSFSDVYTPPGVILSLVNPVSAPVLVTACFTKKVVLPNNKWDIPDAPSWLVPLYGRYLLDGLLGNLMMQRGKSYSDPDRSQYHIKRFRDGMDMAKTAVMRSNLLGGQAWRYPRGYRWSSQRGSVSTPFPLVGRF